MKTTLAILTLLVLIGITQTQAEELQRTYDDTWVVGTPQMAPDGTFVGSGDIAMDPNGGYHAVPPAQPAPAYVPPAYVPPAYMPPVYMPLPDN